MAPILRLFVLGLAYLLTEAAPKSSDKQPSCQEFSKNVSFKDDQAIGIWHLLHFKHEKTESGETHCVEFSHVGAEERKKLEERIGKYIENLNWENLKFKMQIPCSTVKSNRTRDYYLEKLEGEGAYRTLQMPAQTAKLDLAGFHRYPMRLKLIENQYLAMMDCHEKFVFLLGKQPPNGKELDERIKKMIDTYWPEELQ